MPDNNFVKVEEAIEIVLKLAREKLNLSQPSLENERNKTACDVIEDFAVNVIAEDRVQRPVRTTNFLDNRNIHWMAEHIDRYLVKEVKNAPALVLECSSHLVSATANLVENGEEIRDSIFHPSRF